MAARVWPVDAVTGAPSYTGRALRQGAVSPFVGQGSGSRPLGGLSGVRPSTPITIATATSTTWTVTPFLGLIDGEAAAIAGVYAYSFDSNQTGSVTAAAGSARIDRLDVQVDDPAESDGSSVPAVRVVRTDGSPGSGVPAAAPSRSHPLALINVPAFGGGSPTVTWNASYYAAPGAFVPFNTLTGLQAWTTATVGQHASVINDATTANNGDYTYTGAVWSPDVFATASGSVNVTASGITTVTFPSGRFTVAPIVQCTVAVAGAVVAVPHMGALPTATNFGIRAFALASATQCVATIHWTATQMTPTSAAG